MFQFRNAFIPVVTSLAIFGYVSAASPELPTPCDTCLPGVMNFAKVDQALWRGAQPTAEGFKALRAAGVKTVVSFRDNHDDAPQLKGSGLRYLRIPSKAWHPRESNLVIFLKVMENPDNWPVFVHCAEGRDRTGYSVAAYRMARQDWKAEAALQEMDTFHRNSIWLLNPRAVRHLDIPRIRARVDGIAEPILITVP